MFIEDPEAKDDREKFVEDLDQQGYLERSGQRLDFIPFQFVNVTHNDADVEEPPLLDLVDVNIDHFKLDANYKLGLEKCGIPILWAAGFEFPMTDDIESVGHGDDLNNKVTVSPDYMLVTDKVQAEVQYAEFSGQGLQPLKEEREKDEERMAVLGARLLETPKAGVESAASQETRHSGEKSMLAELATTGESGLEAALGVFAWWMGWTESPEVPEDVISYKLNKDYVSARMTPQMLREWTSALLSGSISYLTYYHVLEEGELTRPGVTVEDEMAAREAEEPVDQPRDGEGEDGVDDPPVHRLPPRPTTRTSQ